jgi:hypothetical protein
MIVDPEELRPGLVLFLDPEILEHDTRTKNTPGYGGPVLGPHFFLVLRKTRPGRFLLTPLFSRPGYDRIALDDDLKTGRTQFWRDQASYMFRWEFWLASTSAVVDASARERSPRDQRNGYALHRPDRLAELARHHDRNREGFRPCAENRARFIGTAPSAMLARASA